MLSISQTILEMLDYETELFPKSLREEVDAVASEFSSLFSVDNRVSYEVKKSHLWHYRNTISDNSIVAVIWKNSDAPNYGDNYIELKDTIPVSPNMVSYMFNSYGYNSKGLAILLEKLEIEKNRVLSVFPNEAVNRCYDAAVKAVHAMNTAIKDAVEGQISQYQKVYIGMVRITPSYKATDFQNFLNREFGNGVAPYSI